MDNVLLFITGVLSGLIVGFLISRVFGRTKFRSDGSTESLLQERLLKADDGLKKFSDQFEAQAKELKEAQKDALEAREKAARSSTELKTIFEERKKLENTQQKTLALLESVRQEKESLNRRVGELTQKIKSQETEAKFFEEAKEDLIEKFKTINLSMLQGSRDYLVKTTEEKVTTPFSKQVEILRKQVEDLSKDSSEKLVTLAQSTTDLRKQSEDVKGAALKLTSALRSPNIKGQWGEVNLKRIIEFAGLIENCDFNLQVSKTTEDGTFRPDCVIDIPDSRQLIIDAKAPIESYTDALDATNEKQKEELLDKHLKKMKSHIDQLSNKDYSSRFGKDKAVDGVILFIPIEGALSMALERDPKLLQYAFDRKVILTFPTSLLAILKGMSMVIKQAETVRDIKEILNNADILYKRFKLFTKRYNDIGKNLTTLNSSFNESVTTYKRIMITGKKFAALSKNNSDFELPNEIDDESVAELPEEDEK